MLSRFFPAARALATPLEQQAVRAFTASSAAQNSGMELIEKKFQESVNQVLKIWSDDEETLAKLKTEFEAIKWPVGGSEAEIKAWSGDIDAIYKKMGLATDLEAVAEDVEDMSAAAPDFKSFLAGLAGKMSPAVHADLVGAYDGLAAEGLEGKAMATAWAGKVKEVGAKHGLGDVTDDAAVRVAAAKALFKAIESNVTSELSKVQAKMGASGAIDVKAHMPAKLFAE